MIIIYSVQVDRVNEEGLVAMLQRISTLSYGYEGRLELHLVGAFSDTKGLSAALIHSCLSKFQPFIKLSQRCPWNFKNRPTISKRRPSSCVFNFNLRNIAPYLMLLKEANVLRLCRCDVIFGPGVIKGLGYCISA